MEEAPKKVRRHDIDWLRVILFGLLIPFYVAIGVYWNLYGDEVNPNVAGLDNEERWEIAEEGNDYTTDSVDFTSMVLHWMHQWRLAALFMMMCYPDKNDDYHYRNAQGDEILFQSRLSSGVRSGFNHG